MKFISIKTNDMTELHICKYCGIETTQPDDECYAKPTKKMTAVEWLVTTLNNKIDYIPIKHWDSIRDIVQQALKMEKQQMNDAYQKGFTRELGNRDEDFEQYYNETYKKNKT